MKDAILIIALFLLASCASHAPHELRSPCTAADSIDTKATNNPCLWRKSNSYIS